MRLTKPDNRVLLPRTTRPVEGFDMDAIYVTHPLWPDGRRKSTGNAFCWREPRQEMARVKKAHLGRLTD